MTSPVLSWVEGRGLNSAEEQHFDSIRFHTRGQLFFTNCPACETHKGQSRRAVAGLKPALPEELVNNAGLAPPDAVIFDMDGVLVDSNPFHIKNWSDYLRGRGVPFDPELLPKQILGQRNDTALRSFFGPDLTREQSRQMSEEIEANFREIFRQHAKPFAGLMPLIEECRRAGIPIGVASSAMKKNVDLVVESLGLRPYFRVCIDGDQVAQPKPDPQIYLLAAERLGVQPSRVVAFEDSFVGIEAVHSAGMKCVAIASTFPFEQLRDETKADWVARSFEEVSLDRLRRLFRT